MRNILHLTNGDTAVEGIRSVGVGGDVVPWRDVLHEGPVPGDVDDVLLREMRIAFVTERFGAPRDEVRREFEARDAALDAALAEEGAEEIVLWFEHDLYDQLQLLQILARAAATAGAARLRLAQSDEYLGTLDEEGFAELWERRAPVTSEQLALARRLWDAFRSPDPRDLQHAVQGGTHALPYAGDALLRHLEELPATGHGLSRSERQILMALHDGPRAAAIAYQASHHEREARVFLGDSVWAWYVESLGAGEHALLRRVDRHPVRAPAAGDERSDFWRAELELTEEGARVLEGEADRIALLGIDRWLGGVHLRGRSVPFRWDGLARRVVAAGRAEG